VKLQITSEAFLASVLGFQADDGCRIGGGNQNLVVLMGGKVQVEDKEASDES